MIMHFEDLLAFPMKYIVIIIHMKEGKNIYLITPVLKLNIKEN